MYEVKSKGHIVNTLHPRSLQKYQKYLWEVWYTDPLQR